MDDQVINQISDAFKKINAPMLIRTGVVIVVAVIMMIAVKLVFKKLRSKYVEDDDYRKRRNLILIKRSIYIIIIVMTVFAVLQVNGINVTGFSLGIGTIAVIVSLAFKDALQDIIAGSVIMIDKYFKVGDAVEYEGKDGVVIYFSVRTTKIEYLSDRSVMSVANRNISKIRRLTHLVDIDVPLSYDVPRQTAFSAMNGICEGIRGVEGVESCEFKGTEDFGSSAIIYKIRFFCEPHDRPDIRRAALKVIQDGLAEAGLHIPYNQIDVHTS